MSRTDIVIPVEQFVRHELNDEDANALLDFWEVVAGEVDPEYRPSPREQRLTSLRIENPHQASYEWMVRKDDDIIATGVVGSLKESHPGYEQTKNTAFIGLEVHPRYRNQGIGTALMEKIAAQLKTMDKTTVIGGSEHDVGKAVAEHWGGVAALAGAENRLQLADVDWNMVEQWVVEGPTRAPDVTIQEFNILPDDIAEEYIDFYSEVMNQQPLGDLDFEMKESIETWRVREDRMAKLGIVWITLITREVDGAISGMTEMLYNPQNGYRASQNLTGVRQQYRGKGLGKWLKAEMLLRLRERYPDIKFIATGNADSNAPMLSINERLGFKRFKSNVNYNFKADELIAKFS